MYSAKLSCIETLNDAQSEKFLMPINCSRSVIDMSIKEVCCFSNGLDIIAAATVCTKWHQIIQERSEFVGMITHYFFSKMCHIIHGNPSRISTADYYLLGDRHCDVRCRKLYQKLILQSAQHHYVIVLTEGFSSMTVVPPDSELWFHSESMLVGEYFGVSNVDYIGWDNPEARMKKREELQTERLDQEISENFENIRMAIEERDSLAESRPERQKLEEFVVKRLLIDETLKARLGILLNRELLEILPARTLSMVETLQQIEKMRMQGVFKRKVKIIVHCGLQHLRTATQNIGRPEFDLAPLYKTLEKLNAVVMIPKFLDL